jgi:hypothetical protein
MTRERLACYAVDIHLTNGWKKECPMQNILGDFSVERVVKRPSKRTGRIIITAWGARQVWNFPSADI